MAKSFIPDTRDINKNRTNDEGEVTSKKNAFRYLSSYLPTCLRMKNIIPFICLATLQLPLFAQDTLRHHIDEIIRPRINSGKNVGIVVGIICNGKPTIYTYGSTRNDTLIHPDSNTVFEIGSVTKVFTALLLSDMVKDSIVHLYDPVQKYLPDSIRLNKYAGTVITLEHLANHTSGLPRLPYNLEATIKDENNPYADYTENDLYSCLKNFIPKRKSGAKYDYSNLGAGLLGNILAKQAHLNFEELVIQRICHPLKMQDTRITLTEDQKKRLAPGHNESGKPASNWDFPSLAGAGALRSTISDMLKFLSANLGLVPHNPLQPAIDSSHLVTLSTVNLQLEIALGWHISPLGKNQQAIIWHNGGTGGYRSFIGLVKPAKTGVVILTNSANSVDEIAMQILELIIPYNPELEKKEEPEIIKMHKKAYSSEEKK